MKSACRRKGARTCCNVLGHCVVTTWENLFTVACGIWFPDQGSNPAPLQWAHAVLATGPPGKSVASLLSL